MIKTKQVYVITAFFKGYEEEHYTSPSEVFFADTFEEAKKIKTELEQDERFSDIIISETTEERDMII